LVYSTTCLQAAPNLETNPSRGHGVTFRLRLRPRVDRHVLICRLRKPRSENLLVSLARFGRQHRPCRSEFRRHPRSANCVLAPFLPSRRTPPYRENGGASSTSGRTP